MYIKLVMANRYWRFKHTDWMTPEEIKFVKENQFDFDERLFGSYVICDPVIYTEPPVNCNIETVPISFRNGDCRADAVCYGYVDTNDDIYVSEYEMDIGICIEWDL